MKFILNLIFLTAMLCLQSCDKEEHDPEACFAFPSEPYDAKIHGSSQARSNVGVWNGLKSTTYVSNYPTIEDPQNNIRVFSFSKRIIHKCDDYELGYLTKNDSFKLGINLIPYVSNGLSNFAVLNGGDAIAQEYILIDTVANYFIVDKITEKTMTGRYNLYVKVVKSTSGRPLYDPTLPEVLSFEDGTFTAIIE